MKRQKARGAEIYKGTYEGNLKKIVHGSLIHADETKVSIGGKEAFVWVFTNMEEVAYLYTETREGDFLQELLQDFKGVLVSDFYAAYDAINCAQQKCLIHLMRDLNNDLLKYPFNEEMKGLVQFFAILLKPVVLEKSNGPTQPSELAWLSPSWSLSGAGLLADCPQDTPGVLGAGGVQSVHPSAV